MTNDNIFKPGKWIARFYGTNYPNSIKAIGMDLITHYIWKDKDETIFSRHISGIVELSNILGYDHRTLKAGLETLSKDGFLVIESSPYHIRLV